MPSSAYQVPNTLWSYARIWRSNHLAPEVAVTFHEPTGRRWWTKQMLQRTGASFQKKLISIWLNGQWVHWGGIPGRMNIVSWHLFQVWIVSSSWNFAICPCWAGWGFLKHRIPGAPGSYESRMNPHFAEGHSPRPIVVSVNPTNGPPLEDSNGWDTHQIYFGDVKASQDVKWKTEHSVHL